MVMDSSAAPRQEHLKGRLHLGSDGWCCVLPELFSGLPASLSVALTAQNCSHSHMWDPSGTINMCNSWTG